MVENEAQGANSSDSDKRPFLCGVVEGFYGRPWTLTQRKHLFEKMQAWAMNSYLYAPKDDCKHRAYWRELYTVEEADHLQSLISAAHECNVNFIYAISPGLDITYSSSKEIATLKRKIDQVSQLGCKSFALLFDDIEAEMSKADKESFQSFAHAQVSVTNEIYEHLGQPQFLFCPTQYCTARAVPTISTSEYLKTIGEQLAPHIDIMWTGDKVIPKEITVANLQPITQALKRPPVIWDNEHANDYDPRRIYLGPYSGRSPDLIPKLRGVLTNPNCEYGANYVAIHTLAAWSKCTVDGCSSLSANDTVSADIKLELGDSAGSGLAGDVVPPPPDQLPPHVYHPRLALRSAIKDWVLEFSTPRNMWGPITKPQVGMAPTGIIQPSVNTCMTATTTTSSINSLLPSAAISENGSSESPSSPADKVPLIGSSPQASGDQLALPIVSASLMVPGAQTPIVPVMNSLVSSNTVIMERPSLEMNVLLSPDSKPLQPEPMETNLECEGSGVGSSPNSKPNDVIMESNTNPPTPASVMQVDTGGGGMVKSESTTMLCEPVSPAHLSSPVSPAHLSSPVSPTHLSSPANAGVKLHHHLVEDQDLDAINEHDLQLICDLFYLPCEHGPEALDILSEFYWLKSNAGVMLPGGVEGEPGGHLAKEEWFLRRQKFNTSVANAKKTFDRLCSCVNREVVYNLYTYVWDLVGVLHMLASYIDWLTLGKFSPNYKQLVIGRHTWFSGIREAFISGDHEPWVFRGGLTADLQRLMPVDSGNDLFMYMFPDHPTNLIYKIRQYRHEDENTVLHIALQTWEDGMDASQFYTSHPKLVGEKSIGPFLNFYSHLCFVFEGANGEVVGYMSAAPDVKDYYQKLCVAWLPELRSRYPKVEHSDGELFTPCEATINSLHCQDPEIPPGLESPETMALIRLAILPTVTDQSLLKRSIMLLLACLRTSGVLRVVAEVPKKEKYMQEVYGKIGFTTVNGVEVDTADNTYLSRSY